MYYYSHHIGDFIRDTARLNDAQTIAYLRLIWLYYQNERPLEGDHKKLAFQIGACQENTLLILEHFFIKDGDLWIHKRCESELDEYRSRQSRGKHAAEIRWKNAPSMQRACNGHARRTKNDANQEPITNNQEPVKNKNIHSRFDARLFLSEQGVDEKLIADWTTLRRAKKLPLTETAINGVQREATKAGLLLADAITICCERGWAGFKAEWLDELKLKENRNGQYADFVAELTGSKRKDRAENVIDGNAERLD